MLDQLQRTAESVFVHFAHKSEYWPLPAQPGSLADFINNGLNKTTRAKGSVAASLT